MKSSLKIFSATLMTGILLFLPMFFASALVIDPVDNISKDKNILQTILEVSEFIVSVAGAVAVLALIYGGVWYIISRGNEEYIEKAKDIIKYALIGLVVILFAYVIVITTLRAVRGDDGVQSGGPGVRCLCESNGTTKIRPLTPKNCDATLSCT